MNETVQKPWGKYEVLHSDDFCQAKLITIKPQQRISYQFHYRRQEHWTIIRGVGEITINGEVQMVGPQTPIQIGYHVLHRLANTSETEDLVFIEIQTGEYFGEDDIIRLDDDYDRVNVDTTPTTPEPVPAELGEL